MQNAYIEAIISDKENFANYSDGAQYVAHAYANSLRDYENLVFSSIIWERQIPGIIETLRAAGIDSFIIADNSTALMEALIEFVQAGFTVREGIRLSSKRLEDSVFNVPPTPALVIDVH